MDDAEPYLIRSSINHTQSYYRALIEITESVPFDGPEHERDKYLDEMRHFIVHVDHCMNYHGKHSPDEFIPLPFELGYKTIPRMFKPYDKLKYTRGMDQLTAAGILEKVEYDKHRGKCRKFRIPHHVRLRLYQPDRDVFENSLDEYKDLKRGFNALKRPRGQRSSDFNEALQRSIKLGLNRPEHDLSNIKQPKVVKRYQRILDRVKPNTVNLDVLLMHQQMLESRLSSPNVSQGDISRYHLSVAAITTILDRGVKVVSRSPLIVKYYPEYRVAKLGGRLFEIGGGFQTLPSIIKHDTYQDDNYDIVSSQWNILRMELRKRNIKTKFFDTYPDVGSIAKRLDVSRSTAKIVMYGTLFSAGIVSENNYCSVYQTLGPKFKIWRSMASGLLKAIKELASHIYEEAKKSKKHTSYTNVIGIKLVLDNDDTAKAKRQILAHHIQGIEFEYILRTAEQPHNTIVAFEHDGLIGTIKNSVSYYNLELESKTKHLPNTTCGSRKTKVAKQLAGKVGRRQVGLDMEQLPLRSTNCHTDPAEIMPSSPPVTTYSITTAVNSHNATPKKTRLRKKAQTTRLSQSSTVSSTANPQRKPYKVYNKGKRNEYIVWELITPGDDMSRKRYRPRRESFNQIEANYAYT